MPNPARSPRPTFAPAKDNPKSGILEETETQLRSSTDSLPSLPSKLALPHPMAMGGGGGGCPIMKLSPRSQDAFSDVGSPRISVTSVTSRNNNAGADDIRSFKEHQNEVAGDQYDLLRHECEQIEENIHSAEAEVLKRDEESFVLQQSDAELSHLKQLHANEVARKKGMFETLMAARKERKRIKALHRSMMRETKQRDQKIQQQDLTSKLSKESQIIMAHKRSTFAELVNHIENIHEKTRKQLVNSQERKNKTETILNELQTRHLKEEMRSTLNKKHQVKMNHQKVMDKKVTDHLRETQMQEMKQIKDRFDNEVRVFNELSILKTNHLDKLYDLETQQSVEVNTEKERLVTIKDTLKVMQMESEHQAEIKRLILAQKASLRQVKEVHKKKLGESKQARTRGRASTINSALGSRFGSTQGSRSGSVDSLISSTDNAEGGFNNLNDKLRDMEAQDSISVDSKEGLQEKVAQLELGLKNMQMRHKEARQQLLLQQSEELEQKEKYLAEKTREMESNHELEMIQLQKQQEAEIAELLVIQNREIAMEQSIQDAEFDALMERRMLSSVLDTVIDGIICINPVGIVSRFNRAAEIMFGYTAKEVLGQNIKMLMPPEYGDRHDAILANYMKTGVRHVIGSGRKVVAKKKNGEVFPVHLSISEVKEDGVHLFTGIVRDMTVEDRLAEEARQAEESKKEEMQALIKQLDYSKRKADELVSQMLPSTVSKRLMEGVPIEPECFDSCTIMFTDIVGFTSFSSSATPFAIVSFLNKLYSEFDSTITMYDAYK
ncbi:hypothetical protein HDV05_007573, partial [Chytridiales sp. JEL 0842]